MRLKISWQFSFVVSVVLLFTMSVFTFFDFNNMRNFFHRILREDADRQSAMIVNSTQHLMLENNRERLQQMIEGVTTSEGIQVARLINKQGRIVCSSRETEIGSLVDNKMARPCKVCHAGGAPKLQVSSMDRSEIFRDDKGTETLGLARGIYSRRECSDAPCHYHPPEVQVLGVLDIEVSTEGIRSALVNYRNHFIVEIFFVIMAIGLSLMLLIQRLVIQPVSGLLEHTRAVTRGEWKEIQSSPGDELGELADSFNDMTRKLRKAMEERDHWAATLESRVEDRTREIKQMQSVLIRSEKLASLGELTAGIAHELNNPLTGILMLSTMAVRDPGLDPERVKDFQTIINEVSRCSGIVQGLLDFSRETAPRKGKNSVNETMERSLALIQHHALFQDISISRRYQAGLPDVQVDSGQLEQVFLNMLVNAAQSMEGGGDLTISTGMTPDGKSVFTRIQDTGCGIPEDILPKIFDPFFTTKGPSGTGLGLAVSYGIIENHGGRIEVQSQVGVGTVFTISLPVTTD